MMVGDGYSTHTGTGPWYHDDELDKSIIFDRSITVGANVHSYYCVSEKNYHDFMGTTIAPPSLTCSIVTEANVHKPLGNSLVLSGGGLECAPFSINAKTQYTDAGDTNIVDMTGGVVGTHLRNTVLVGSSGTIPDGTKAYMSLGDEVSACTRYDDVAIALADFNAKVADGTIDDGEYAILGDGNLTVWDDDVGMYTTVALSGGTNSIYRGVVVTDKHPKYSARATVVREMRNNNNSNPTWRTTIDLGSTNNNRVNSGAWSEGISVGDGHILGCPGNDISGILCVGEGNDGAYTNVRFVSMVGGDITLNDAGRAYAANGDSPVFPTVEDVHILNSGCNLGLGSLDPYATNEFKDALVLLDGNYDPSVMGIFQHPVAYYSQPNDAAPGQPWAIDWNEPGNASAFMIDPNLFTNYREAWAHCAETHDYTRAQGIAFWDSYSTSGGIHDPVDMDVHWTEVTQYAEAHQSENDTYRGNSTDLHGFTDPFKGKTRAEIRTMIGKPKVPMVYTGGIALAGYPSGTDDQNFGLVKLGHVSKPVAYIKANPVAEWGGSTSNLLSPVSVTGTTDCPYAGMVLAIDGKQEIDGTMHLVLAKKVGGGNGGTTTFTRSRIPVTGDATETMEAGYEYSIVGTSGTLTFDVGSMQLGEESLVIVPASGPSVKISGQTLNAGTTYLIRRASYIASAESTPSAAALAIPCLGIH
jgi:hypothetical protein